MKRLKLIPVKYYSEFVKGQTITLKKQLAKIKDKEIDSGYAISVSAVSSAMLEGNLIDIETYFKFSITAMNTKTKAYQEIKALENAYNYARNHALNLENLLHCHKLMSETGIVEKKFQGKLRDEKVHVMAGRTIVYEGIEPEKLHAEIETLFNDISLLKSRELNINQLFYFASLIHLMFVLIHPFADGNGRAARLLEKWFLSHHLGTLAWKINSEKLYLKSAKSYHNNINKLGINYDKINMAKSLPFLKMLPMALLMKKTC
jgi:Fic family protein